MYLNTPSIVLSDCNMKQVGGDEPSSESMCCGARALATSHAKKVGLTLLNSLVVVYQFVCARVLQAEAGAVFG